MLDPVPFYRLARWLYLHRIPVLPRVIKRFSELLFHCVLPYTTEIGPGFEVGYHGFGIVVHPRAVIGKNVFISPSVTVGGRSGRPEVPRIGDNVFVSAGARLLGDIDIGSGSVIGANAVVLQSIPPRSVAVGVPARIVRADADVQALTGWPPPGRTLD